MSSSHLWIINKLRHFFKARNRVPFWYSVGWCQRNSKFFKCKSSGTIYFLAKHLSSLQQSGEKKIFGDKVGIFFCLSSNEKASLTTRLPILLTIQRLYFNLISGCRKILFSCNGIKFFLFEVKTITNSVNVSDF